MALFSRRFVAGCRLGQWGQWFAGHARIFAAAPVNFSQSRVAFCAVAHESARADAITLLEFGVTRLINSADAAGTAVRLRNIWMALKELVPSAALARDVSYGALPRVSEEHLIPSRKVYEDIFTGLERTRFEDLDVSADGAHIVSMVAELERRGDSLAYGEITFEGVAAILLRLRTHGFPSLDGGTLVDVGSGMGNIVVAAALLEQNLTVVSGVEFLPGLHMLAQKAAERYCDLNLKPSMRFLLGDAAQLEWAPRGPSSIVIMHATGFSDELLADLAEQAARVMLPGSMVLSLTLRLPSAHFEVIDRFEVPCSWGSANAQLMRRVGGPVAVEVDNQGEWTGDVAAIVASTEFCKLLVALVAAPDCRVAREAAATLAFVARAERNARKLAEFGVVGPLVDILRRGLVSNEPVSSSEDLPSLHAAGILAVRSFCEHSDTFDKFQDAALQEVLEGLARRGSPSVRMAASSCLEDFGMF